MEDKLNLLKQVEQLKFELHSIGYSRMQLTHIVNDFTGNKNIDYLALHDLDELVSHLENQIKFANKCRSVV